MLLYVFLLCLISWTVDARSDYTSYIQPYTYTSWGSWASSIDWCPPGTYANGFTLKIEAKQGSGDDTALNGIKLNCRSYCGGSRDDSINSNVGAYGDWKTEKICPTHYLLRGASVKSEPSQGGGDDTAVNDYDFECQSYQSPGSTYTLNGNGMPWGGWTTQTNCPANSYICGIKTQVEGPQGRDGDDTSLNDAKFYCCSLPTTCT